MNFKLFFLFAALLMCSAAHAQINYSIERDSAGFVMIQEGRTVAFDTATVHRNLAQKDQALQVLENEIQLIERLVLLRRQAALVRDERNTLTDILEKARQCKN